MIHFNTIFLKTRQLGPSHNILPNHKIRCSPSKKKKLDGRQSHRFVKISEIGCQNRAIKNGWTKIVVMSK